MTIAHSGSQVSLVNITKALPEGMILFPFNGRISDTTTDIPILSSGNIVYKDAVKKYQGSVFLEEATTNLFSGALTVGATSGNKVTYDAAAKEWTITGTTVGTTTPGFTINSTFPQQLSKTYVLTFEVWADVSVNLSYDTNDNIYLNGVYDSSISDNDTWRKSVTLTNTKTVANQWVKVQKILTTKTYGTSDTFMSHYNYADSVPVPIQLGHTARCADSITSSGPTTLKVRNIQYEEKLFPTSYVDGTRSSANLRYDISNLGMKDRGCVSFWVQNSDAMRNSTNWLFWVNLGTDALNLNGNSVYVGRYNSNKKFRVGIADTTNIDLGTTQLTTDFAQDEWIHIVYQWDVNKMASGNSIELYINGVLATKSTATITVSSSYTQLLVGGWNGSYMSNTCYEQVAIHPSKAFTADEIKSWYTSQAPFYDWRDQILFY